MTDKIPAASREGTRETKSPERAEPIARASLHDEVVTRLRAMIIEGDIAPGARVPERILCERFAISRTPLREALKVLASEGLLVLTPNRGATVPLITVEDVDELFPVMGALEALSGELACERLSEDQLAEIRAQHYQMVVYYRRRELSEYFRLNQRIHERILDAAANPTLTALHRSLAGRIRRARYQANMSRTRWEQAVAEHEAILEALENHDGAKLAAILKKHLHNTCETVKEALSAERPEPPATGAG